MNESPYSAVRNRAYYAAMRHGPEWLIQAMYDHLPSFREWWGVR